MFKKSSIHPLILYGVIIGLLLIILHALRYKTLIRSISIEAYGAVVGILFLGFGIWLGSEKLGSKSKQKSSKEYKRLKSSLSPREMDVLVLLSEGLTNQQIAGRLYLSLNTIKTHISNIYSKLGVERRTQAIQKARR